MTAFFGITGIIMLLERPFIKYILPSSFSQRIPTFVISTLLVLLHVPFSHWYYGDWVVGGYFNEIAIGLWQIKKI